MNSNTFDNLDNKDLLKLVFELKKEVALYKNELDSYKVETNNEILYLENIIEAQKQELKEKNNKIKELETEIININARHSKVVTTMQRELSKLREDNKDLRRIIREKDKQISELNKKVSKLEKENEQLKNTNSKNSSNSSKPPSSDGFHKQVHSMRQRTGKKVGGQLFHKGTTLTTSRIDKILNSNDEKVVYKKEKLYVNNKALDGTHKYVVDSVFNVVVTDYELIFDRNASPLPKKLKNDVTYGDDLKSLVVLLNVEHAIPVNRIVNFINELSNNLIELSTGTIVNFLYELTPKVQTSIKSIINYLLRCQVNHKDETMLYCNLESRWFHVFSNKRATYYYIHKSRGNIADIEKGVLRIFTGTLVHDHMKGLYRFQCDDAECNAHIMRYLQFTIERYSREWAKEMQKLLSEIKDQIKEEILNGNNCFSARQIYEFRNRYESIIEKGYEEYKNDSNPNKDYNGDDMKLLRRLEKYEENHLAFMHDFNIPFDNNLAERDLRMIKAKKKISGCFRSDKGGETYTDIKSYLSTVKKQHQNLFLSIKSAFNNEPFMMNI